MAYKNKYTGRTISNDEYSDRWDKSEYEKVGKDSSVVDSAIIGAVTDSAILGGFLGGSITGGILGDLLDGDLLD